MDLIEPAFRPLYERICVGNKGAQTQDIFFEGLLLSEGLGMSFFLHYIPSLCAPCSPRAPGKDQPWYGKSAWGHPDFDRKSVCGPTCRCLHK